jgi:hypothetical protein
MVAVTVMPRAGDWTVDDIDLLPDEAAPEDVEAGHAVWRAGGHPSRRQLNSPCARRT